MAVDMIIKEENDIQEKDIKDLKEEIINIDGDNDDDDTETIFDKKEDLITPYSLSFKDYFFQSEDYDEKEQKNIKTHLDNLNHILDLVDYKKRNINQSKSILELKYIKYKKCLNMWNTITIVFSSFLTLIESSKLVFIDSDDTETTITKNFFILSPIAIGTFITCSSGIIKFKKYQEQMEEIYILIDKSISIISKLKKLKDEIFIVTRKEEGSKHISDVQEFFNYSNRIQNTYKTEIIQEITNVYQETERYINYNDYHKYLNIINYTTYKKHVLSKDKKTFFEEYEHHIHEKRLKDIKNISLFDKTKVRYCCCHRKKKLTIPHQSYDDIEINKDKDKDKDKDDNNDKD